MNKQKGFSAVEGLVIFLVAGIVGFGGWYVWSQNNEEKTSSTSINTYEECVAAGHPVMESYPEQCAVPGGQTFVRSIENGQSQAVEAIENETKDIPDGWIVYKNNELGISFIHPEDWIVDEPFGNVTDGAVKILHTTPEGGSNKCEIRGCGYNYYLEFNAWDDINNTSAKGGSYLGMKVTYANLNDYITDEFAIKKMTAELPISGVDAYEVRISDITEYYGIMLQKDEQIIELGFPNVFASEEPDETIKTLRDSIAIF